MKTINSLLLLTLALLNACSNKNEPKKFPETTNNLRIDESLVGYRALADEECSDQVALAWDPNPESEIAGYKLSIVNVEFNSRQLIDVGLITKYTVTLAPGTYRFSLFAYNTSGLLSSESASVTYVVPECDEEETDHDDDDNDENIDVDMDEGPYDPSTNTLSAHYTSGSNICPGQVYAVETTTDLVNWVQNGEFLITPFNKTISVNSAGAKSFFMRLRALDEPVRVEPCVDSSSSSSSDSSHTSSSSSSDSSSSDSSSSESNSSTSNGMLLGTDGCQSYNGLDRYDLISGQCYSIGICTEGSNVGREIAPGFPNLSNEQSLCGPH